MGMARARYDSAAIIHLLAGMGFWCLGPYDEPWVTSDACSAANWIVHGVSMLADLSVLAFLVLLMFRLTPLGTIGLGHERPLSMSGVKGSATSRLASFAVRHKSAMVRLCPCLARRIPSIVPTLP